MTESDGYRFAVPPNWPSPPSPDWRPEPGWQPDQAWGPPPEGWAFWVPAGPAAGPAAVPPPTLDAEPRPAATAAPAATPLPTAPLRPDTAQRRAGVVSQNPSYVVVQVILKEKLWGTGSGNLTELEKAINAQASQGYRLHTITTAASGSKGLGGGDRIQATMVFERL